MMSHARTGLYRRLIFTFVFLCGFNSLYAAAPDAHIARDGGDIYGQISYCGPEGSEGILVHIPGQSFSAFTDATGSFTLMYVPPGTWNLQFVRDGRRLGSLNSVNVIKKMRTDILASQGVIQLCSDLDGDGYPPNVDCDEGNPAINPGAQEICGDGKDNNCNGETDETCPTCTDSDGDGFFAQAFCQGFRDCDDTSAAINPGALESCGDGIDNNCDGAVDENTAHNAQTFYFDGDGDGYGDDTKTVNACTPPAGYIATGGDCNDSNALINPAAEEICSDGLDNNCDGQTDEPACVVQGLCTQVDIALMESCTAACSDDTCILNCYQQTSQQCQAGVLPLFLCASGAGCFGGATVTEMQFCAYDNCTADWETAFGPDYIPTECTAGATRSCGVSDVGACQLGTQTCNALGRWDACVGNIDPVNEICDNGIDENCDGIPDDNCFIFCSDPSVCDDGLACTMDTCDEQNQACTSELLSGACLIDNVCYMDSASSPTNQCQTCDSANDPIAWTNVPNGTPCASGVCSNGACVFDHCNNTVKDYDETDVDCGGATCGACATGRTCNVGSDCLSGSCVLNICM